jgi:molybdenum cofactor cytidylyltransferase
MGGGRHKLLLPLGDRPVLVHTLEATLASRANPIVVVLGHQAEAVRSHLAHYATRPGVSMLENPDYPQGMSTSLRLGLQWLMQDHNASAASLRSIDGALILLGDQPLVTPGIIDALIAARQATGGHIITPLYEGKRGSPVLFAADLFPELMRVTGDEGGKSVIERHRQELTPVELGDARANYDVDTWDAYQEVLAEWWRRQESAGTPLQAPYGDEQ